MNHNVFKKNFQVHMMIYKTKAYLPLFELTLNNLHLFYNFSDKIKTDICMLSSTKCLTIPEALGAYKFIANISFYQNYSDSDLPSVTVLRDWKYLLSLGKYP